MKDINQNLLQDIDLEKLKRINGGLYNPDGYNPLPMLVPRNFDILNDPDLSPSIRRIVEREKQLVAEGKISPLTYSGITAVAGTGTL